MIPTWLLVLLTLLAVARLTTLVNDDYITEPIRAAVDRRGWSVASYFLSCPWCVSIWLGIPFAAVVYAWPGYGAVQVLVLGLAASYVTGMLALVRDRLEAS